MTSDNPNGPDPDPHIHEYRRQLLLVRGYFDDLAGFPADTQANILKRLRELAGLTGEPMLTNDQIEALVRERDTAREEADTLCAEVARLRPLRALFDFAATNHHRVAVYHIPGQGWMTTVDESFGERWNTQGPDMDTVIAAACDRLGVDHG